jgi:hypothetical protein
MRARYVFDKDGDLVERKTGEPLNGNMPDRVALPMLVRDVHYKSPLSGKEITSRSQRREEMKVHNVREVEPSEYRPVYRSRKWAERMRGDHDPKAGQRDIAADAPFKRIDKTELPQRIARTIGR